MEKRQYLDWSLFFIKDYLPVFITDNNQLIDEIPLLIQEYDKSLECRYYRREVIIKKIPFLLAIDRFEKKVALCSPYMRRELLSEDPELLWAKTAPFEEFPLPIEILAHKEDFAKWQEDSSFQALAQEKFTQLKKMIDSYHSPLMERINDFTLSQLAQYDHLRNHILRFLSLFAEMQFKGAAYEVKKALLEALRTILREDKLLLQAGGKHRKKALPPLFILGLQISIFLAILVPAFIIEKIVRFSVSLFASRFIAGESISKSSTALLKLFNSGRCATVDLLGELVLTEEEAAQYESGVISLLEDLFTFIHEKALPEVTPAGLPTLSLSVKVSALSPLFSKDFEEESYRRVAPRLKRILLKGKELKALIQIDAEHYPYRDLVFNIYKRVLLETPELFDYQTTGIVIQAYLQDAYSHFQEVLSLARARKLPMPIRLVKGAYWDSETQEAMSHKKDPAQFLNKEESDLLFEQLVYQTLKNSDSLQLCLASHNFSEHIWAEAMRDYYFPKAFAIEHQCLHMTCEALSLSLRGLGYSVRDYLPIGDLLMGVGYLVRRIIENSSQVGFLAAFRLQKGQTTLTSAHKQLEIKKEKKAINYYPTTYLLQTQWSCPRPLTPLQEKQLSFAESLHLLNPQKSAQVVEKLYQKAILASSEWGNNLSYEELVTPHYKIAISPLAVIATNSCGRRAILNQLTSLLSHIKIIFLQEEISPFILSRLIPLLEEVTPYDCFENREEKNQFQTEVERCREEIYELGGKIYVDRLYDGPHLKAAPILLSLPFQKALKESDALRRTVKGPLIYMITFQSIQEVLSLLPSLETVKAISFWTAIEAECLPFQKRLPFPLLKHNSWPSLEELSELPTLSYKMGEKSEENLLLQREKVERMFSCLQKHYFSLKQEDSLRECAHLHELQKWPLLHDDYLQKRFLRSPSLFLEQKQDFPSLEELSYIFFILYLGGELFLKVPSKGAIFWENLGHLLPEKPSFFLCNTEKEGCLKVELHSSDFKQIILQLTYTSQFKKESP